MQAKTLVLIMMAISTINASSISEYGGWCDEKLIFDKNKENYTLKHDTYQDYYAAYNKVPSCASLHTDENYACCYMKVKFKNNAADKTYTHYGCVQIGEKDIKEYGGDFKKLTKDFESEIERSNTILKKVKVSVDCNSNIIKLTGLVLLAFLL